MLGSKSEGMSVESTAQLRADQMVVMTVPSRVLWKVLQWVAWMVKVQVVE